MLTRNRILILLMLGMSLLLSCKTKSKGGVEPLPEVAPTAPNLFSATNIGSTFVKFNWNDRSDNEDGFILYMFITPSMRPVATIPANQDTVTFSGLTPNSLYLFQIASYNEVDTSTKIPDPPLSINTTGGQLPPAPGNITAVALSAYNVEVGWDDHGNSNNFIIQRKTIGSWVNLDTIPDNNTEYLDADTEPLTQYYYRVGAGNSAGVSWSPDSAVVTTPTQNTAPQCPNNLTASVIVGTGVRLAWQDRSENETAFYIHRNYNGSAFSLVDSVGTDCTSYTDAVSGTGIYNYRVYARNQWGVSPCYASTEQVEYDYCSDGVIPICTGNLWEYDVSFGSGDGYRHSVAQVVYPDGLDYYLIVKSPIGSGQVTDSLYYYRNFGDIGCRRKPYPLSGGQGLLYFKHPCNVGDHYSIGSDSMVVVARNTTLTIGSTTYTGVTKYELFTDTSNIFISVKPETIGILQVDTWNSGGTLHLRKEDLVNYIVRN